MTRQQQGEAALSSQRLVAGGAGGAAATGVAWGGGHSWASFAGPGPMLMSGVELLVAGLEELAADGKTTIVGVLSGSSSD